MSRRLFLASGAAAGGALALGGVEARGAAAPPQANFIRYSAFDPRARLDSYRRGVDKMREWSRANPDDPRGWTFQAAIHGSLTGGPFFNQCEHASWWFLPWHRAYLYYFERIIREASGDRDFTLPYWDWNEGARRSLPAAFRDQSSALFDDTRLTAVNAGEPLLGQELDPRDALSFPTYLSTAPRRGFGGIALPGRQKGLLERPPHDTVHVLISGNMGDPRTAGLDPIFWLHHANVDRLWDVWLSGGRSNPADAGWKNNVAGGARKPFVLFDERGQRVEVTTADVIPGGRLLDYGYDNLGGNTPLFLTNRDLRGVLDRGVRTTVGGGAVTLTAQERRAIQEKRHAVFNGAQRVELTATENRVVLGAAPVTVRTVIPEERRTRLRTALELGQEDVESPPVIILNVEDVRSTAPPGVVFRVFLNQPDANAAVDPDEANYIGSIALFQSSGHSQGSHDTLPSESFSFDITRLGQSLRERGRLDESKLDVTFVSKGVGGENAPRAEVTFRRVSISVER